MPLEMPLIYAKWLACDLLYLSKSKGLHIEKIRTANNVWAVMINWWVHAMQHFILFAHKICYTSQ